MSGQQQQTPQAGSSRLEADEKSDEKSPASKIGSKEREWIFWAVTTARARLVKDWSDIKIDEDTLSEMEKIFADPEFRQRSRLLNVPPPLTVRNIWQQFLDPSGRVGKTKKSGNRFKRHIPGHNHYYHLHQKNIKAKLIALIKKFRTDGSDFDSEEQYREALERELMKAAAGRGSRAIEELLEEEIEVEEESNSEREDWDNISESTSPKPSLRPFFSSTTLDKI